MSERGRSESPRGRAMSDDGKGKDGPAIGGRGGSRSPSPAGRPRAASRSRSRSRSQGRKARSPSPRRRRSRSRSRRRSRSRSRRRSRSGERARRRSRSRSRGRGRSPYRQRSRERGYGGGGGGGYGRRNTPPRRPSPPAQGLTMFVAGFPFMVNERDVEEKFGKYGRVADVRLVRQPGTGESRGFGFVRMEADEDVDEAVRKLDGTDWHGRRLLVERARNARG